MLPEPVAENLTSRREAHIEKLFELLRFPSVANDRSTPDACGLCAEWLAEHLAGLGLAAEIVPTAGKPNVLGEMHVGDEAPTLLIYGHYDVQPPDPLDMWLSDPFEPEIRDGAVWARGADDNKGQLFAQLLGIEAWQRAGGPPVNVKLFIEGEEEIGSPRVEEFVTAHASRLSADACVISDSEFFADGIPSITYALRGLAYFELTATGPRRDVHSGTCGGAVRNPIHALAGIVSDLHDRDGRIALEGFYDDVLELTDAERDSFAKLPFDEARYAADVGVDVLGAGEQGRGVLERIWARPTADCNGLAGGYAGPGAKTIIPSRAGAKVSFRLVPNQAPDKVVASFRRFVAARTPPGVRCDVHTGATARPVLLKTDSPAMRAGKAALAEAFGAEPALVRCGASVPVTEQIQRLLGLDAVLMGFGLPDDNLHSPNEHFHLDQLWRGAHAAAAFMQQLAERSDANRRD